MNDEFAPPDDTDDDGSTETASPTATLRDAFVTMCSAIAFVIMTSSLASTANSMVLAEPDDTVDAAEDVLTAFRDAVDALRVVLAAETESDPMDVVPPDSTAVVETPESSARRAAAAADVAKSASTRGVSKTASDLKAAKANVKTAKADAKTAKAQAVVDIDIDIDISEPTAAEQALAIAETIAKASKACHDTATAINCAAVSLAEAAHAAVGAETAKSYAVSNITDEIAAHRAIVTHTNASTQAQKAATHVSTIAKTIAFTNTADMQQDGSKSIRIDDDADMGNDRVQSFLHDCFELVSGTTLGSGGGNWTGKQKVLRGLYFLLINIRWLPPNTGMSTAKLLPYMDANNGKLRIHSALLVFTPEYQRRREEAKALFNDKDPIVQGRSLSHKMQSAKNFFKFIGFAPHCIQDYEVFENNNSIMLAPPLVALWNKGRGHGASSELQSIAQRTTSQNITTFQKALSTTASALGFTITADTTRPVVDGKQCQQTIGLRLQMNGFGPPIIGAWMLWSDPLKTKVRVRDWESTHRKHAEDQASYQLTT